VKNLTRRHATVVALLLALCLAATASAAPRGASGPKRSADRTITVGIQQNTQLLPIIVGLRHGYFKKTGITDVKFVIFGSLAALFTGVSQAQLDIGYQTLPSLWAYDKATSGSKLKVIAPATNDSIMFFSKNDAAIPVATKKNWKSTVLAWKGKKVGVPATGGIIDLYARYMIKQAGLSPSDVTITPVGTGPPAVAALQNGIVDIISGDPLTEALLGPTHQGHAILSFPEHQGPPELLNAPSGVYFTSESQYQKEPALYQQFNKAVARARAYMANPKHKQDMIDLLVKKIGVSPAEGQVLYRVGVPIFAHGAINKQIFDSTVASYASSGVLKDPLPTYSDLVFDFVK
jgi:ABC-type nitrate/sulfonate/bicarbonate transport system substrate-binding protein